MKKEGLFINRLAYNYYLRRINYEITKNKSIKQ